MPERPADDPDRRFDEELERQWRSVFRFALAWTNDWPAVEDLAQDAFLRLWTKRATIDWSAPILPWLMTTTRHLATGRFRRLRRRKQMFGIDGVCHIEPANAGISVQCGARSRSRQANQVSGRP